jgi:hypothetical protein
MQSLKAPRLVEPPPGKRAVVETVRSKARPERHFADSFITICLAIERVLTTWLPRCPLCQRPRKSPSTYGARAPLIADEPTHSSTSSVRRPRSSWPLWETSSPHRRGP